MARIYATTAKQQSGTLAGIIDTLRETFLPASRSVSIPRAWANERGVDIHRCHVDVLGGFPGNLKAQHQLQGATVAFTDRYMIVGEATSSGFALPLDRIRGTSLVPQRGIQPPLLMVWYQDTELVGAFALRFRGSTRTLRGVPRAVEALRALTHLGIETFTDFDYTPPVYLPWDKAESLCHDDVLWQGDATASCSGPMGSGLDAVDVWLTERHLIWVPRYGTGLNHLPLEEIVSCRSGHADRLAIGIQDNLGARYDLYFDLSSRHNRQQPAAQVVQILAAAGVPIGYSSPPLAPWRSGGTRRPGDL